MFADAGGAPSVNIESFPAGKPVLADFLRPPRDKLEALALTLITVVLYPAIFEERFLMGFENVATETSRISANAGALVLLHLVAFPSHIDAALHSLISMVELPCEHFPCSRCHADLFDELQDLSF